MEMMGIFEKFSQFVNGLKRDKWLHIIAGLIIFGICLALLRLRSDDMDYLTAWSITATIAAVKEVICDKLLKIGTPEWTDFVATVAIPTIITLLQLLL